MGNFTKEGPGVKKNAMEKKRIFVFFELFFRKFWNLMSLNMIYILALLPVILVYPAIGLFLGYTDGLPSSQVTLYAIPFGLLILAALSCFGPASAAFTFVLRNYSREEHVFLWSDYWEKFRENYKIAAPMGILDLVAILGLAYGLYFYYTQSSWILMSFAIASLVIVLFMNFYMWQLIITIEATFFQMIRNAFIFAFIGMKQNIFSVFWCALLTVGLIYLPIVMLIILLVLIIPAIYGFIITFNSYAPIKKHILDPYNEKKKAMDDYEEIEPVFSDDPLLPPSEQ